MGVCLKLVKWDIIHKRKIANLPEGVNLILTILNTHKKQKKLKKERNSLGSKS